LHYSASEKGQGKRKKLYSKECKRGSVPGIKKEVTRKLKKQRSRKAMQRKVSSSAKLQPQVPSRGRGI
jgi:hypothetical protein